MKILFLIFSFNTGGIERLLIDLCNEMSKRGLDVTLCVINNDYKEYLFHEFVPEVHIIRLERPMGSRSKLSYMARLARIIRQGHYDILHCQGLNCVIFSILAKLCFPHVKILNTVHDVNNFPSYSRVQVFLHNLLCSHIIAISTAVKQEILARGTKPQMVTTIYNAIDTKRFCLCSHPHMTSNQLQCLSSDMVITIGNVARIMPEKKGQMVLLEAINILKDSYPSIRCLFAGPVALHHEDQMEELQHYVITHHLEDQVVFLGNVEDIPQFLSQLDVFVLPSFYEGFGIALIEALATGIPCVASRLDGPEEIMESADMGLLFSPGNAVELSDSISAIIQNYSAYRPSLIAEHIQGKYSIENMVTYQTEIYLKCLKKDCHKK